MGIRETLERSETMLCKGIDEINDRGDLNASNLELLGEAVDALKDIYTIKEKTGSGSYERYMPPVYMSDGHGYDRRRDNGYSTDYSYRTDGTYGHSNAEEKEFLRWKMQNAPTEQEREMYRRKIEMM